MMTVLKSYLPKNKSVRMFILMIVDIVSIQLTSFLALWVRFDMNISRIPPEYIHPVLRYALIYTITSLLIFFLFRLYATMWSVAGIREVYHIVAACGLTTLVQLAGMVLLGYRMPRSYYIICFFLLSTLTTIIRLSYRIT